MAGSHDDVVRLRGRCVCHAVGFDRHMGIRGPIRSHGKLVYMEPPVVNNTCMAIGRAGGPPEGLDLRRRISWARPATTRETSVAWTADARADEAVNPWINETDAGGCIHGLVRRTQAPPECNTIIFVWSRGPPR